MDISNTKTWTSHEINDHGDVHIDHVQAWLQESSWKLDSQTTHQKDYVGVLCSIFKKGDNNAILYNEFVAQAIEWEDVKGKEMTTQNTTPSRRMMLKKK
jgi:hypothetical protein